jgi:hypothetical protein
VADSQLSDIVSQGNDTRVADDRVPDHLEVFFEFPQRDLVLVDVAIGGECMLRRCISAGQLLPARDLVPLALRQVRSAIGTKLVVRSKKSGDVFNLTDTPEKRAKDFSVLKPDRDRVETRNRERSRGVAHEEYLAVLVHPAVEGLVIKFGQGSSRLDERRETKQAVEEIMS